MSVGPDAVPVGAYPATERPAGVPGRPPAQQPRTGVGTGIREEVDEELVAADQVFELGCGDDAVLPLPQHLRAG